MFQVLTKLSWINQKNRSNIVLDSLYFDFNKLTADVLQELIARLEMEVFRSVIKLSFVDSRLTILPLVEQFEDFVFWSFNNNSVVDKQNLKD